MVTLLQPGLSPAELDAVEVALGFPLPDEVREWFSWHNGVEIVGVRENVEYVLPNAYALSPLQDCLETRTTWMGYTDPELDHFYSPAWLPLTMDRVSIVVADCSGAADSRDAPAPVYVLDQVAEWELVMPSITDMVRMWTVLVDQGCWRADPEDGAWDVSRGHLCPEQYRRNGLA